MNANELLDRLIAEAERAVDHNDTTPICDVARLHLNDLKRIEPVESHEDRVEELEEDLRTLEHEYADSYTEEYLHEYAAEEYDRGLTEGAESRDDEVGKLEEEIESLEECIEQLEEEVSELEKKLGDDVDEINALNKVIAQLKDPDVHTRGCCPTPE